MLQFVVLVLSTWASSLFSEEASPTLRGTSAKVVCPPLTRGRPEPRQHLGIGGHAYEELFHPLRFNSIMRDHWFREGIYDHDSVVYGT